MYIKKLESTFVLNTRAGMCLLYIVQSGEWKVTKTKTHYIALNHFIRFSFIITMLREKGKQNYA